MKTRGELKAEARELLAGNWGKAIVLNIIPILGAFLPVLLLLVQLLLSHTWPKAVLFLVVKLRSLIQQVIVRLMVVANYLVA